MSGMPHPKTATLEEGGRTMNGCAGEPMDLLTGDEWAVEDIGGAGVIDIARTSMQFGEDGRVTGSGACNRYGASYTLTGEGLSIGPVMATKRGCVEAVMDQEDRFFTALDAVDRFEIDATGALVLFGGGEQLLLARR
jgi:heat shock protein HslJ